MKVSACQQTRLSLDGKGDCNSLKKTTKTDDLDGFRMPSYSLVSGWRRKRMTIILLRMPMDSLVFGR